MACFHPVTAFRTATGVVFSELSDRYDILGRIELPCGQCIGCRMRRASDWELRIMHEAQQWESCCFVTLTYAKLPVDASLNHRDWQLFMKRLRARLGRTVRFYMCGEYGEETQRPHYHACLFNVDFMEDRVPAGKSGSGNVFYESALLEELWSLGRCSVQDLTPETASYCARYIMKKILGPESERAYDLVDGDGVVTPRRAEYSAMSLKPGIGFSFSARYRSDIYPNDYVVSRGKKRRPPKYYDRLLARDDPLMAESVAFEREKRGRLCVEDSSPDRLAVREKVAHARVRNQRRSFSDDVSQ